MQSSKPAIAFGFALSFSLMAVGIFLLFVENRFGLSGAPLIVFGAVMAFIVLCAKEPVRSMTVQTYSPMPDDGGKPTAKLQEWLNKRAPESELRLRSWQRMGGDLLAGVGAILAFGAGAFTLGMLQGSIEFVGFREMATLWVIVFALGLTGMGLSAFGKGIAAPTAVEVLSADGPRPVLLLRSFEDDRAILWKGDAASRKMNPLNYLNTIESTISEVFLLVAPVVAVGKPGEKLPPSGAARVWLSDNEWQTWVTDLIQWSKRIVMILGDPKGQDGLAWEIGQIFSLAAPQKIVIVIPPHLDEDTIANRWNKYCSISPGRMPPYQADALAIHYSPDWQGYVTIVKDYRKQLSEDKYDNFKRVIEGVRDWIDNANAIVCDCSQTTLQNDPSS